MGLFFLSNVCDVEVQKTGKSGKKREKRWRSEGKTARSDKKRGSEKRRKRTKRGEGSKARVEALSCNGEGKGEEHVRGK